MKPISWKQQKELLLGCIDVAGRQAPLNDAEEEFSIALMCLLLDHCKDRDAMRQEVSEIEKQKHGKKTNAVSATASRRSSELTMRTTNRTCAKGRRRRHNREHHK